MQPVIEIASPLDTIEFHGTPDATGWVYDNDTLDGWLALAEVEAKFNKRPNAHGTYSPDQLFVREHRTPMTGQFYGADAEAARAARGRLSALFSDGRAVMMTVTDDGGPTTRTGFILDVDPEWQPDGHFTFSLLFGAPDPRRYGTLFETSDGLPTPSGGLVWPLGTNPAEYWDWGAPGNPGRVEFTNNGNTATYPVLLAGEGGSMPSGFFVVEVDTGREIAYSNPVQNGEVVRLDNRTQRATINGGDVTKGLSRKEWFAVPPGATHSYQFGTLGAVTGAPTLKLLAADAHL